MGADTGTYNSSNLQSAYYKLEAKLNYLVQLESLHISIVNTSPARDESTFREFYSRYHQYDIEVIAMKVIGLSSFFAKK